MEKAKGKKDDHTKNFKSETITESYFICAECKVIFSSRSDCSQHLESVHSLNHFDYHDAEILIKSDTTVAGVLHRKPNLPPRSSEPVPRKFQVSGTFRCPRCALSFDTSEVCLFHESSHAAEGESSRHTKFVCRICQGSAESESSTGTVKPDYNFDNWAKCSWHAWKEHNVDCELVSCPEPGCQFKAVYGHKVREHEAIHSPGRGFRCNTCHKSFKQLKQLRTHEKYHEAKNTQLPPPAESRWYTTQKCEICSRILSDSKCLKKHIAAVHNKLKPHSCQICGHQSARKAELQLHLRTHTREKPHHCPTCEYTTGDHNSLRRHILTHSSFPKPYQCPLCAFSSIQSAGFKRHIVWRHTEEETDNALFVCSYCPKLSINKTMFEQHVRDHDRGLIAVQDNGVSASEPQLAPAPSSPRPVPYWDHDDDSVEIVDTGGITIPAKPATPPLSE